MTKTALVTGAGRGLGLELTRALAADGYRVLPLIRDGSQREQFSGIVDARDVIVADVSQDDVIDSLRAVLEERTAGLDLLINNAGNSGWTFEIDRLDTAEVADLFQVHCLGVLRCVKGCLPALRCATKPRILNITSRLGSMARVSGGDLAHLQVSYSYRIAKASQNMLTLCLGQELSAEGIQVVALHPGQIRTRTGSADASMEPRESAAKIVALLKTIDDRVEFYDLHQGTSPW